MKFLHKFAYKDNETLSRLLIYFVDPYRVPRGYDIYHVTNHMLGRFAAIRRPSVVTVHDVLQFKYRERMGSSLSSLIYNRFMDQSIKGIKQADRIICVSAWSADEVSKALSIPREKISVVYNGLDHETFYPRDRLQSRKKLNLPIESKIILNVGSEIKRKNLDLVFKAFKTVASKNPSVWLLRLGEKTPSSSRLIEDLGIKDRVIYLDILSDTDVPFVYSAADLLVIPSFDEGFGFPVIEAQSCGISVVASNLSSLPEVAGDACFYIRDTHDASGLAEILMKTLDLPDQERRNLIDRGYLNAQRFSWENNARGVLSVYKDLVDLR